MNAMTKMCCERYERCFFCLHVQTYLLVGIVYYCLVSMVSVKIALFRPFCICFYGMELWSCYTACAINRLRSCYIKCVKTFFKYSKYYSVTSMLLELGLPSFDTLIINSRVNLTRQLHCSNNC